MPVRGVPVTLTLVHPLASDEHERGRSPIAHARSYNSVA